MEGLIHRGAYFRNFTVLLFSNCFKYILDGDLSDSIPDKMTISIHTKIFDSETIFLNRHLRQLIVDTSCNLGTWFSLNLRSAYYCITIRGQLVNNC